MNPFTYRPGPVDPDDGETDEWEDNHLSNAMAWAARTFLPAWCQTPEHWTAKFSNYFYTSCPCCLMFRGVFVGVVIGAFLAFIVDVLV